MEAPFSKFIFHPQTQMENVLPATLAKTPHHAIWGSSMPKMSTRRHCPPGLETIILRSNNDYTNLHNLRFNLVCNNEDKQKFLGTLMMSGLLIGSVIGGLSGDYFGRKKSLYAATLVIGVSIGRDSNFNRPMFFTE